MSTPIANNPDFATQPRREDGETVRDIRVRARQNAGQVLKTYWDGQIPVDPVTIARRAGADVFVAQLGTDTYGMIIGSGSGADIYLDQDQAETRMRFTCAHELGHYVDHSIRGDSIENGKGYVDKRSDAGRGTADEIYANEFAASILMPEEMVRRFVLQGYSLFELSEAFKVSLDAMSWRLRYLGLSLLAE